MFELRAIEKRYGEHTALDGVDLTVPPKETLVLLGPSGCGKSTILKVMIGLVRPDRGEVRFAGEPVVPERSRALRRRMGYVVQGGGLFPHLTARANVTLMARRNGWSTERINARIEELTVLTRYPGDALHRLPAELSGGQAQRVSLMRALMLDPEVLLLDEPLGALDPITRFDLQEELRSIFARLGKTVVLVTHDLGEAVFFADEIALMRDGRIVQRGTLRALVERPVEPFVTRFVNAHRSLLPAPSGGSR
ncbi:MAG: ATP-binding cassette domain-containing protein [Myxococcaceae bacterium]